PCSHALAAWHTGAFSAQSCTAAHSFGMPASMPATCRQATALLNNPTTPTSSTLRTLTITTSLAPNAHRACAPRPRSSLCPVGDPLVLHRHSAAGPGHASRAGRGVAAARRAPSASPTRPSLVLWTLHAAKAPLPGPALPRFPILAPLGQAKARRRVV